METAESDNAEEYGKKLFVSLILNSGDAEKEVCELIDNIVGIPDVSDNPDPTVVIRAFMDGAKELKNGNEDIIAFFKQAFNSANQ